MMKQHVLALAALGFIVTLGWASCDKGPMQQTGEKMDRATDQDKLICGAYVKAIRHFGAT